MNISILLLKEIMSLVLIAAAGYVLRRSDMISHEGNKGLTAACVYICVPCALFNSFQFDFTPERIAGFWYAVIAILAIYGSFFVISGIFRRVFSLKPIEYTSVIYGNIAGIILPIVLGVFGSEYVLYVGICVAIQNTFIWSHGQTALCGSSEGVVRKVLTHPCVISIVVGFVFMITGWELPPVADKACQALNACVSPLSMLMIGMLIAEVDLRSVFGHARIYLIILLRHLIGPMIGMFVAFVLWKCFPVPVDETIYLVAMLCGCAPASAALVQMSQLYDSDPGYASSVNVLSTLFCIISIPVMMMIAQMFLYLR